MSKPTQPLFKDIAFIIYPVKDMAQARAFYEEKLGLAQTANWQDQWIEYDIGQGTLAITLADDRHKPGAHGPTVGLEVANLDTAMAHIKAANISLAGGPFDTPVCVSCIIRDPDGNEIILHARK
jgi:predicted enzyme related to lactoylglutathione lyase